MIPALLSLSLSFHPMLSPSAKEVFILGVTHDGRTFRPSDWAERLSGVMAGFGGNARMGYSPHVHPVDVGGVKCVVVHRRIKAIEPMAWDFLLGFARDNELQLAPLPGVAE